MDEATFKIRVIGIPGCQAPAGLKRLLEGSVAVCSSKRLADSLATEINSLSPSPAIIPITPLATMLDQLKKHAKRGMCAVLASGDPLFFGIGQRLLSSFAKEAIEFHPALSAVQIACARFKIPWNDAQIISLHGKSDESVYGQILARPRSIIFTDARNSPDAVAAAIVKTLERARDTQGLEHVRVHVAENLGCPGERLRSMGVREASLSVFSPLNIMIVEIDAPFLLPSPGTGLGEYEISHLRGLITKDEIRAVVLHRLRLKPALSLWDIGAGSGSISIEAARLYPDIISYAVEMDERLQQVLKENIRRFRLFNVIPVDGAAPEILKSLPGPQRIFIGGSRGKLSSIIEYCAGKLPLGGIMVATAILEATTRDAPRFMEKAGLEVDMARISVVRQLGTKGREIKLNEITIIRGVKR